MRRDSVQLYAVLADHPNLYNLLFDNYTQEMEAK